MSVSLDASLPIAPAGDAAPYRLTVFPFPPGHFRVHAFVGREKLSRPYAFDVTVTTQAHVGQDLERLALGQRAAFVMNLDATIRVVPGIVMAVRSEGVRPDDDAAQYRLRIAPALARLAHRKDSRIFQGLRVDEVVERVVATAGVATRWQLSRKYPTRPYCTQYDETDLAFVERLLAEAGIFYFFAPPASGVEALMQALLGASGSDAGESLAFASAAAATVIPLPAETLVLSDDPACYAPFATGGVLGTIESLTQAAGAPAGVNLGPISVSLPSPTLHYLDKHGLAVGRSDKITAFVPERRVRSTATEYRDFDPERPAAPLVAREPAVGEGVVGLAVATMEGAVAGADASLALDFADGPELSASLGGAAMEAFSAMREQRDLETYEHHGRFLFPDWQDAQDEPGRMHRERRRRALVARGASLCHRATPGHRFHLADHPVGPFNREWVVASVRHVGRVASAAELYENTLACVPATVAFPPRRRPRREIVSTLTATVAGPPGEEIHVDHAGRIKVLFHWDRRGVADDSASCWLRVMQPWSGAGWGHQFIPRVGTEVVVTFEGGDPDKPLVIGSVYNGTHPPAFALPEHKTRSGVRTRSTPHAAGFNELSFEDAAAREQIFLHAQRDLDEVVLRNHTLRVGGDELLQIGGLRRDEVVEDLFEVVGGSKEVTIHGDAGREIRGSRLDSVDGNADERVRGVRQARVDGADRLEVGGAAERRFERDLLQRVEGNLGHRHVHKGAFTLRVEGTTTLSSEDGLVLECAAGITLACGPSAIRLGKDGIELVGDMVRAAGKKGSLEAGGAGLKLRTAGAYAHLDEKLLLQTETARIDMGTEVKIDGEKILLNSPDRASDEPAPPPRQPTIVELVDHDGQPLAAQRFVVELPDGSERVGVTDEDGTCRLDLPANGTIRFAELTKVGVA